jgi:hypothetical protein
MNRFDWYARPVTSQVLKIQIANDVDFDKIFDDVFVKYTISSQLISIDSVRSGLLTELVYSVNMSTEANKQDLITEIKKINSNQKVSLITGYNSTDI